jgi:hypothetical protein
MNRAARGDRVNELKARIQADAYVVDPQRVAEALLRRVAARTRLERDVSPRRAHGLGPNAVPPRRPS